MSPRPIRRCPRRSSSADDALARRLADGGIARLRLRASASERLRLAALDAAVVVDDAPLVADGRIELLHWLREQSISITAHRYGNLASAPMPSC